MSDPNTTDPRENVFRFCARRYKEITVDGVGSFRLRSLSERERAECEVCPPTELRARLIAYSVCDNDGNRMFGDRDIEKLMDLDSAITGALIVEIEHHCRVVDTTREQVKN